MSEWAQITTRGPPALDSSAWVKWTRMDSDCSSCALTMTCASPTPTIGRSPSTRFPGDTRAQSVDTNWIWSYSGVPLSRTFYTHVLNTVRIATQTTPWCVARSDCNQRGSIALRSREHRIEASKMSQPNIMSKFAEAFEKEFGAPKSNVSTTEKWEIVQDTMHRTALATFGKIHQRLTIGLTQSRPKWNPSSRLCPPTWWSTNGHPADYQSCQEQGSTNREAMCNRVLRWH